MAPEHNCTKKKSCKSKAHWAQCPKYSSGRLNDDATYNRSDADYPWYAKYASGGSHYEGRGDSMG